MGLGELLSGLLGDNSAGKEASENAGAIYRIIDGCYAGIAAANGLPVDTPEAENIKSLYVKTLEHITASSPFAVTQEISKLIDDGSKTTKQNAEDLAGGFLDIVTGHTAELQLEGILGLKISNDMPFTRSLMDAMAIVTDISAGISIGSVVTEIASVGQVDAIGQELRGYMDYSGVSQITGYGYGLILSSALTPVVQQEINSVLKKSILDIGVLTLLRTREIITESNYYAEMAKNGFSAENTDLLMQASNFYPTGQDFVTFAARDVFSPSAISAGQLDSNFPVDIIPYAKKAGMSEEVLRWYWRSHWQLPSPQMGYEMLQRGVITLEQLKDLLKTADWAPGWIDKLIAISYNPLTRVDAKNMYKSGVLTDEQYKQAMRDLGYSEENAELYLKWVKSDKVSDNKDLSQSAILSAYKLGIKDKDPTIKALIQLGYDKDESNTLVSMIDAKIKEDETEDAISVYQYQYQKYQLTDDEFLNKAGETGIPRTKAQKYLDAAINKREKSIATPPLSNVKSWYQKGLITSTQAEAYLKRLGYQHTESSLFMAEWNSG
jgi:Holliday junction resolvasome RuvABC DNA-binding subunit